MTTQESPRPTIHRPFDWRARVLLVLLGLLLTAQSAYSAQQVRIALLKFGTASWELDTVSHHGLDRAHGFELQTIPLAGKQATMVALQSGETDMALTDWLWVSRQRSVGRDFSFIPYSTAAGSLVVPKESDIHALSDLKGKRVGVAGGPLDKNWLLFRALAIKSGDGDLADTVEPVFGAPPLLNQQLERGRLDAVINFWPYVARLTAKGMRVPMSARAAARELGLAADLPLVGYVFDAGWAHANPAAIAGFTAAVAEARKLLQESDAEWERLRPLMRVETQAEFEALRDGFRSGIPAPLDPAALADAARLIRVLADLGGRELTGEKGELSPGTFWELGAD